MIYEKDIALLAECLLCIKTWSPKKAQELADIYARYSQQNKLRGGAKNGKY